MKHKGQMTFSKYLTIMQKSFHICQFLYIVAKLVHTVRPPKCYPPKCNTSLNAHLFLGPTNIISIDFYLPKYNTSLNACARASPDDMHLERSDCTMNKLAKFLIFKMAKLIV